MPLANSCEYPLQAFIVILSEIKVSTWSADSDAGTLHDLASEGKATMKAVLWLSAIVAAWLFASRDFMLVVGVLHKGWWSFIPTIGIGTTLAISGFGTLFGLLMRHSAWNRARVSKQTDGLVRVRSMAEFGTCRVWHATLIPPGESEMCLSLLLPLIRLAQ